MKSQGILTLQFLADCLCAYEALNILRVYGMVNMRLPDIKFDLSIILSDSGQHFVTHFVLLLNV